MVSILNAYAEAEKRWPTSSCYLTLEERNRRYVKQMTFIDAVAWTLYEIDKETYDT